MRKERRLARCLAASLAFLLAGHDLASAAAALERPATARALPALRALPTTGPLFLPGAPNASLPAGLALPAASAAASARPIIGATAGAAATAAIVAAAPAQAAPQAALAGAMTLAAPQDEAASASAASSKSEDNRRWEGFNRAASRGIVVDAAAPLSEAAPKPALSPSSQTSLDSALAAMGTVPAPRVWRNKAAMGLLWAGLTGAGALAHHPFERMAPIVIALVFAPIMTIMWGTIAGSYQSVSASPEAAGAASSAAASEAARQRWLKRAQEAAAAVGLPEPRKVAVVVNDSLPLAFVRGSPHDYELELYTGLDSLPEDQQGVVLRHELGHVRHHDQATTMIQMFLAPLGPTLAMLAGAAWEERSWIALPVIVAAVLAFGFAKQLDEYHADQFAAHAAGSPAPLIRYFVADSKDPNRAAQAVAGRPFAEETGLRGFWLRAWDWMKRFYCSHPSHDRRIARLARLARQAAPVAASRP